MVIRRTRRRFRVNWKVDWVYVALRHFGLVVVPHSSGPRMLDESEIEMLRKRKREIAERTEATRAER